LTHPLFLVQGYAEAWQRFVSGAEFEDSPKEWGRVDGNIWVHDDDVGANIPDRQKWF
jgi:hypothetical protein